MSLSKGSLHCPSNMAKEEQEQHEPCHWLCPWLMTLLQPNKPLENSETMGKYFSIGLGKATKVREHDTLVILAQLPYTSRVYCRPE